MKFLIHAYPKRMWYVEEFLLPSLMAQGATSVEVWNDTQGKGNLLSCVESFASREGDGGTWHIQDDTLICRDFVERCKELDDGVVYGFCNQQFRDDPGQSGRVHLPDAWHSFQCVRIPDDYAREFADWYWSQALRDPTLKALATTNKGDDYFFSEFLYQRHPRIMVTNAKPCLTEHVDMLIGGSAANEWRGYWARAEWFDETLVDELREKLRNNGKTHESAFQ